MPFPKPTRKQSAEKRAEKMYAFMHPDQHHPGNDKTYVLNAMVNFYLRDPNAINTALDWDITFSHFQPLEIFEGKPKCHL